MVMVEGFPVFRISVDNEDVARIYFFERMPEEHRDKRWGHWAIFEANGVLRFQISEIQRS